MTITRLRSGITGVLLAMTVTAAGALVAGPAEAVSIVASSATTTRLSTTRAVAYNGQPGNVVATVKATTPSGGVPTGSVDFLVDGAVWWTSIVDARGKATLAFADLGPGTYVLSAAYSGDATHDPSTATSTLTQTILPNAPTAAVSFTPATVAVGGTSRLVVSATNNGPTSMPSVALGVVLPGLPFGVVSLPPGAGCRRSAPNLLYCLVSIPRGATRSIVLTVVGTVAGTFSSSGYARNIDTMDETGATATLTVQ